MTIPDEAVQAAEAEFTAYFVKNYPGPDTVIFKPEWHAPKIFRAALHSIRSALPFLQGVKVKALDWSGFGAELKADAFGIVAFYRISGKPNDWTVTWPGVDRYVHTSGFQTQTDAKAAAQADREDRFWATADVTVPAPSPRAQALEEARRQAIEDVLGALTAHELYQYRPKAFQGFIDYARNELSSQPVAGRCKTVDERAAYLCDEFDFDLNPVRGASWPEHENDEGKREGGFVRLQPSDVQAYARENAKRILAFLGLPLSPGASE